MFSYLLSDHLGSTTVMVDSMTLAKTGELRYSSWGETRYSEGTTPTNRRYTDQDEDSTKYFGRDGLNVARQEEEDWFNYLHGSPFCSSAPAFACELST